jgi:hypothetical protein
MSDPDFMCRFMRRFTRSLFDFKPDVINLSHREYGSETDFYNFGSKLAASGVITVASAGNKAENARDHWPSAAPGFISVGSTTESGSTAASSNWGESVDIMAPGENITVSENGQFMYTGGTSFAAPLVSAIILLMKDQYIRTEPKKPLNWLVARHILRKTAVPMSCKEYCSKVYDSEQHLYDNIKDDSCRAHCCDSNGETQHCTAGLVDAHVAVLEARKGCPNTFLLDSDKYLVDLKQNTDGLYQGSFVLSNVGCGSESRISDFKIELRRSEPLALVAEYPTFEIAITDLAKRPCAVIKQKGEQMEFDNLTSEFDFALECGFNDLDESAHIVITQHSKGRLPYFFKMDLRLKSKTHDRLHNELHLIASHSHVSST